MAAVEELGDDGNGEEDAVSADAIFLASPAWDPIRLPVLWFPGVAPWAVSSTLSEPAELVTQDVLPLAWLRLSLCGTDCVSVEVDVDAGAGDGDDDVDDADIGKDQFVAVLSLACVEADDCEEGSDSEAPSSGEGFACGRIKDLLGKTGVESESVKLSSHFSSISSMMKM